MPPKRRKADPMPDLVSATVVVPWRPTPDRTRLWEFLSQRWAAAFPDWEVLEACCPDDGPWRKGVAVADGIARASHDVIVVADADVWCDGVAAAAAAVAQGQAGWAVPHHLLRRLTASATDEVLATGAWPTVRTTFTYAERPYVGHPGGGMVVLTRQVYRRAPIDPRFAGWGQEDNAWAVALRLLAGREWRGTDDMWHLWHAPQPRQSRMYGSSASAALLRRYMAAKASPRTMTALIAEAAPVGAV